MLSLSKLCRKWLINLLSSDKKDGVLAWRTLKEFYEKKDPKILTSLNRQLLDAQLTPQTDPIQFAVDFDNTIKKLKSYGHSQDDYLVCDIFMRAIANCDEEWKGWTDMIIEFRNINKEEFNYQDIYERFVEKVKRFNRKCDGTGDIHIQQAKVLNSTNNSPRQYNQYKSKDKIKCQFCNKFGHSAKNCNFIRNDSQIHAKSWNWLIESLKRALR